MGFALGGSSLGNLAAGSAFGRTLRYAPRRKRAPRRRLPVTLSARGRVQCGSRLWVAVKRVTQSEVAAMDYDADKVDDAVLALFTLTVHEEDEFGARAWKGHDWETLNRLHEKGFISDPVSKAKSVVVTPKGLAKGRELFAKLFSRNR